MTLEKINQVVQEWLRAAPLEVQQALNMRWDTTAPVGPTCRVVLVLTVNHALSSAGVEEQETSNVIRLANRIVSEYLEEMPSPTSFVVRRMLDRPYNPNSGISPTCKETLVKQILAIENFKTGTGQ